MRPVRPSRQPDGESQELRRVTPDDARALIAETRSRKGRMRDRTVGHIGR